MNTGNTRFLYFFANNPRKNPYSGVNFAVDFAVSECFPPQNPSTRVDFEVDFLFRTSDTSPHRKRNPRQNKFRANTFSVPKTRHLGTRKVLEEKFFSNKKSCIIKMQLLKYLIQIRNYSSVLDSSASSFTSGSLGSTLTALDARYSTVFLALMESLRKAESSPIDFLTSSTSIL